MLWHLKFMQGCDASVLLDDTGDFVGEKTAPPNLNSLRGFEVIDAIKSDLESVCPETVSCADILAVVARDSVVLVCDVPSTLCSTIMIIFPVPLKLKCILQTAGPSWEVPMGRRDSFSANKAAATNGIPAPNSSLTDLVAKFQNVGLTLQDMVALSGAHTMGKARCSTFSSRLQSSSNTNGPDNNPDFLQSLQQLCSGSDIDALAQLDLVTPATFDNQYYTNLLSGEGLLPSDQILVSQDQTREIINSYAEDTSVFFEDFKISMLKMGSLGPASGNDGEIRRNCRVVN